MKQKLDCIRFVMKTNRSQKRYVLHHIRYTRFIFLHMCQKILQERAVRPPRNKHEIRGVFMQEHKDYLSYMDGEEIDVFVHQLMNYQKKCYMNHDIQMPHYYACIVTSKELIWRRISLEKMLPRKQHVNHNHVLYARLYYRSYHIHLDIYVMPTHQNDSLNDD